MAALAVLAWLALRSPDVPFLDARAPADWILYPTPPTTVARPGVELEAVFRRRFDLPGPPRGPVRLRWRALSRGAVAINGHQLAAPADLSWKELSWKKPREIDVTALLRPGPNVIEALAANDAGPPALWLALDGEGVGLASDASWEASLMGASWQEARRAATPMSAWSDARRLPLLRTPGAPPLPPAAALRARLPWLASCAALVLALLAAGTALARGPRRLPGTWAVLAAALLLWGILLWHNRGVAGRWGFDAAGHLAYVQEVMAGRLPLADQGWEAYQPPLFYLMAAGWLRLWGRSALDPAGDPDALALLAALGGLAAALQCALVWASLRRLFPERPHRAVLGTVLAAFLPAQLYLGQYVTNEGWLALWSSAALCLALLGLGAVLGLALLTKFSALLTLAAVAAVLAGRLLVRGERKPAAYLRTVGAVLLGALLISGWHYARVTTRFGSPLIGNWDRATGYAWWQDPGYRTAGDLLRGGSALGEPVWSAFHSIPDALYSTLWADGLQGGAALLAAGPPWDRELMAAGLLLALVPTAGLLLGLGAALVHLVRAPSARWFLLLGVLGATGFAVYAMCLRLPFYAQAKAFYGLAALVPLAAVGAWGLDLLAGKGAGWGALARRLVVWTLVGVWALAAFRTYWVDGPAPAPAAAAAAVLDPGGLLERAGAALAAGRGQEAAALARQAVELAPDHPFAWGLLGAALAGAGEDGAAIAAWREALRVNPVDRQVHAGLARLYGKAGRAAQADAHRAWAEAAARSRTR